MRPSTIGTHSVGGPGTSLTPRPTRSFLPSGDECVNRQR
jgi:hypothetical protein